MRTASKKNGFIKNSVSVLSIFAFITAFSSFVAIEFLYNPKTNNTATSLKESRNAYYKELEALPVEPGQGSAYFSISSSSSSFVNNVESSLNLKLVNSQNKSINAFGLAIFVPSNLELTSKPDTTLFSNSVINYVEYLPVSGGTQINIFAAAKPNLVLASNSVPIIDFKFIPKASGNFTIKFVKQVPQYPEIVDLASVSLLDISVLKDFDLVVVKPLAETPVLAPSIGNFTNATTITINSTSVNSKVKYTLDDSDPITNSTAVITSLFPTTLNIDKALTLKAYAYGDLYTNSSVVSADYKFNVAPLQFSLSNTTNLTDVLYEKVSSSTAQAKFYYSTKTPVEIIPENLVPTSGVLINKPVTLYFVGVKDGYAASSTITRSYSYTPANIQFFDNATCSTISGVFKCNLTVLDSSKVELPLTVSATLSTLTTTSLKLSLSNAIGTTQEFIGVKDPNKPNIFSILVTGFKSYGSNPMGIITTTYSNGLSQEKIVMFDINFAPLLSKFDSVTSKDTYSTPSFKVSASSTGLLDKIYLYKKDFSLSTGGGTTISNPIEVFSAYLNKSSITDYLIEDKNYSKGGYSYWVEIEDQNTLRTTSNDVDINVFEKGDVNKDFKLDVPNDLFAIIKAIFGSMSPNIESMDLNLDGKVDPVDIIKLLKKIFI